MFKCLIWSCNGFVVYHCSTNSGSNWKLSIAMFQMENKICKQSTAFQTEYKTIIEAFVAHYFTKLIRLFKLMRTEAQELQSIFPICWCFY